MSIGISNLFDRRPSISTVGLSMASFSAVATLLQGFAALASATAYSFDFPNLLQDKDGLNFRVGILLVLLAIGWLYAIYRALGPRPVARMVVIAMCGANLVYLVSTYLSMLSNGGTILPIWQFIIIFAFFAAPIVLLLTRSCNSYYSPK